MTTTESMAQERWAAVDRYFEDRLAPPDTALTSALQAMMAAGMPAISVSPLQGKLLMMLAQIQGARRVLEIGTLGAYSTLWLARGLPADGRVVTLEIDPRHAEVARDNLARAGLAERVEVRVGAALELLPRLAAEAAGPFDLVFIDADKPNIPEYFRRSLALARPGSLIVVDNVVREGAVVEAASADASVQGVRRLIDLLAAEPRVTATALQTVGTKGYDGFVLARVTG